MRVAVVPDAAAVAEGHDDAPGTPLEQDLRGCSRSDLVVHVDTRHRAGLVLIGHEHVSCREQGVGNAIGRDRRGVEHRAQILLAGSDEPREGSLDGGLEVGEHDSGAARHRGPGVLSGEEPVGTGDDDDAIRAGGVNFDERGPGGYVGGDEMVVGDALAAHDRPEPAAAVIVTHGTGKMYGLSRARGGDRLVEALAARMSGEVAAGHRLAAVRHAVDEEDEVDVEAANHDDTGHGGRLARQDGAVSILGIDLGTQSVKVAAVEEGDHGARVLESATRAYPVESPRTGWAETDPAAWLAATLEAARDVLARLEEPPRAVGLSGQMHGVVLCGDAGEPLRAAITWADLRSSAQARRMSAALGPRGLARLGSAAFPGFAGPTLSWLADEEPDVLSRARWALQPKDWLRWALGGEVATDPSDASGTLLYDVIDGAWSPAAVAACGIDPEILPPIVASQSSGGLVRLSGDGLAGLPIAVGGADAACGILGLGLAPGRGSIALGTGAQIASVLARPDPDGTLRTHTFACAGDIGQSFYRLGAVQSAGLAIERVVAWLGADIEELQVALARGVRADDPYFLPFVAGERSPYVAPELRGAWYGLSLATTREAMLRSVLEGMAYVVSAAYEAVCESGAAPEPPVTVLGGGSRDPGFVALLATTLAVPLRPAEVGDATVVGAARLGAALAGIDLPPVAAREHATVDPGPDALVRERQGRWRDLVESALVESALVEGSGT